MLRAEQQRLLMSPSQPQVSDQTARLVREYFEVWNDRRYEAIPDVVADSFVMYDPFAPAKGVTGRKGEVQGPDGLRTFIRKTVKGFPDFHVEILDLLCDPGMAMYEGRLTMSHNGDFFGIPPTGGHAEVRYMGSLRIAESAVVEHRVYPPVREILDQLGLNFPGILHLLPRLAVGKMRQLIS